jgi:hypothetical protein
MENYDKLTDEQRAMIPEVLALTQPYDLDAEKAATGPDAAAAYLRDLYETDPEKAREIAEDMSRQWNRSWWPGAVWNYKDDQGRNLRYKNPMYRTDDDKQYRFVDW